jgi:hypothetical protein
MSAILREDSNMGELRTALDMVARKRGVIARLTTPLYQTIGEIDKAIDDLDELADLDF